MVFCYHYNGFKKAKEKNLEKRDYMLAEKLDVLIEEEVEKRVKKVKEELKKAKKEIKELKEENELLKINAESKNKVQKSEEHLKALRELVNGGNIGDVLNIFGLEESGIRFSGMDTKDAPQWFSLFVQYYPDRKRLLSLFDFFQYTYPDWANDLRFPVDYTKEEVLYFIKDIQNRYITNSEIFSENMGFYWSAIKQSKGEPMKIMKENDTFSKAIPWQLFLENKYLTEDDVFEKLLETIRTRKDNSNYFFAIQKYQEISQEQVEKLFSVLPKGQMYENHKKFIESNKNVIKDHPEIAIKFESDMCNSAYSTFHYLNYPIEMQKNFIKKLDEKIEKKLPLVKSMNLSKAEKIAFIEELIKWDPEF
jgi:hypothetical protein